VNTYTDVKTKCYRRMSWRCLDHRRSRSSLDPGITDVSEEPIALQSATGYLCSSIHVVLPSINEDTSSIHSDIGNSVDAVNY
jgi:hypothetical protein